ncbi:MaoC/PaaZ C-terminal domain-containing protein [Noviherbaspirillum saxi]|uniref:3-alpha,7-alpha, 12-alpha-trihydroxy-5-beta-cholest-24-enoyl-CoA hydratase n=1 Tax=Noviherbaspirillum saxi TaxID=2320863 RepID=A0A3A3FGZ3_9BURK|nr:MaoC/PaaZ C-terminal domain-containing protein [Noviherbaspirillum saxi]RJF91668.1 3-alpha,7-alpha,12-alpha-trihydroxy-5-beta-cholest-24-enoyl-CoA hydratase [Noviherbaspirillum saxi]
MSLNYEAIKNWPITQASQRYTAKDTILYALGVGAATENPLALEDLKFVYERKLQALPTFACLLAGDSAWMADPKAGINLNKVLHGEQFLTIHKPLPAEGSVIGVDSVDEIYDKGADKGAVMYMTRKILDAESGELIATSGWSVFMRGNGGFGGIATGQPAPFAMPEGRAADASIDMVTRPEQATIYRLSGDFNPLHIDPKIATMAGFDKPILHGMCSYGIAGRAVIKLRCGSDASRLRKLNLRFASPVFPGETLRTEVWDLEPGKLAFRIRVVERDVIVLNNGYAEFAA